MTKEIKLKTGDIVEITGGYFKADNGLFRVEHSPGDSDWSGNDWSLRKVNKDYSDSKCKHNIAFWPLMVTVSGYSKRIEARTHNAEHAKIRIVKATAEIKENAPQQEVAESAEIKETVQPENNTDKKGTQTTIINLAGRINEQLAKRAKENISFSDYKTGSATAEYNQHMSEVLTAIENAKTKVSDEGKERLDRLYSRHAANYAKWINKHNANGASHVSVMIAGPSNYNMRKHEQYLNREGRLWEEYDKLKDIFWNINSIVDGDKIIKSGDPSAIEKLKEKLSNALKEHQEYKDYNAKARKEGTEQLAPYILQNSNGRIKSIRDRIARLERAKQQGTKEIEVKTNDAETIRIVDNVDVYRIQIFFPGKPDAEVRTKLKKNGFRWAPSVSAWQAHRNRYNLDKAKEIISSI